MITSGQIIIAENRTLTPEMMNDLMPQLEHHIDICRTAKGPSDQIVLCSAIRKFAMNMKEDQFEKYAKWLLPSTSTAVHHVVEMEFLKGLYYRFRYADKLKSLNHPTVVEIIYDIVDAYLRKSIILQNDYTNNALYGLLCIYTLDKDKFNTLLEKAKNLNIGWFSEAIDESIKGEICI